MYRREIIEEALMKRKPWATWIYFSKAVDKKDAHKRLCKSPFTL